MFLAQKAMVVPTASAGTIYATWNPSAKGSGITLSNGNLTASFTRQRDIVISTVGKSSGKWYWEIPVTTNTTYSGPGVGIAFGNVTTSNNYLGSSTGGWGYYANGVSRALGGFIVWGASYTTGDIIGVALDMDAGTLVFYKNNTSQGTAFTGLAGTMYAAVCTASTSGGDVLSANFGATTFTYTPPSGFNAGLYT